MAFIVDVFSQRIVAWHASMSKESELVMVPLRIALWVRDREGHQPAPGQPIHYSDAGSQYTRLELTKHLALEEIRPSFGTVGDAYDNTFRETINRLYKAERIGTTCSTPAPTRPSAMSSTPPPAGSTGTRRSCKPEHSLRMPNSGPQTRPAYSRTCESIDARVAFIAADLAVSH